MRYAAQHAALHAALHAAQHDALHAAQHAARHAAKRKYTPRAIQILGVWCSARCPSRQVAGYDAVLKALWEWEIVDEDTLTAWVKDERAGRHFGVPLGVARPLREGPGDAFLYWLEQGE